MFENFDVLKVEIHVEDESTAIIDIDKAKFYRDKGMICFVGKTKIANIVKCKDVRVYFKYTHADHSGYSKSNKFNADMCISSDMIFIMAKDIVEGGLQCD